MTIPAPDFIRAQLQAAIATLDAGETRRAALQVAGAARMLGDLHRAQDALAQIDTAATAATPGDAKDFGALDHM